MKLNHKTVLFVLAAFCCFSCNVDNPLNEPDPILGGEDVTSVNFSFPPFVDEDGIVETKAVFDQTLASSWELTDTVGIFPTSGSQIYFSMAGGTGDGSTAEFSGGGWNLKKDYSYYSYFPLVGQFYLDKSLIPVVYPTQTQYGNNNTDHIGKYAYFYTESTPVIGSNVTFKFLHVNCILRPVVTLPKGTYTKITISADDPIFIVKGTYDLTSSTPAITPSKTVKSIDINLRGVTFTEETELVAYTMAAPVDVSKTPLKVTVYSTDGPEYYYYFTRSTSFNHGSIHRLQCTELLPVISTIEQANAALAAGESDLVANIDLDSDATITLPPTNSSTSISIYGNVEETPTLTVAYASSSQQPDKVYVQAPESSNLNLETPNSTVSLNGPSYQTTTASSSTLIIEEDTDIETLNVKKGNVIVYGHIAQMVCDDMEDKESSVITVYGTIDSMIEDDEVTVIYPSRREPQYVDLGLSVKWATFNVGANRPDEVGYKFAFGETAPKSSYEWTNYKYGSGNLTIKDGGINQDFITKYTTSTINGPMFYGYRLEASDDAASVNWGENWRTPTFDEYSELCERCTWTWLNFNGTEGFKVTGPNGNHIFIPSTQHEPYGDPEFMGHYWASTVGNFNDNQIANALVFHKDMYHSPNFAEGRYYGLPVRAVYDAASSPNVSSISFGTSRISMTHGEFYDLSVTISPAVAQKSSLIWTITGDRNVVKLRYDGSTCQIEALRAGTVEITASTPDHTHKAVCVVEVKPIVAEMVDLGLSVPWANINIGAKTPQEVGQLFAFGETAPKDTYTPENYKFGAGPYDDNSIEYITKYNTLTSHGPLSYITRLELEDDAAHVAWGDGWRIPSLEQMDELCNMCIWTFQNMYGVPGYKVTGPNGNYIFIPATTHNKVIDEYTPEYTAEYWESTACDFSRGDVVAHSLMFQSTGYKGAHFPSRKYEGLPIRPVYDSSADPVPTTFSSFSLSKSSTSLYVGDELNIMNLFEATPSVYSPSDFRWTVTGDKNAIELEYYGLVRAIGAGNVTITVETADHKFSSSLKVRVFPKTYQNSHAFVDLGLSVMWARENVGAFNPWQLSDRQSLESAEAVVSEWGSPWRLPTAHEWWELIENCKWEKGGDGFIVIGPNGNSIFIPYDTEDDSIYWSGTIDPGNNVSIAIIRESYQSVTINPGSLLAFVRPVFEPETDKQE